jgi:hypothetical protein
MMSAGRGNLECPLGAFLTLDVAQVEPLGLAFPDLWRRPR